jgi:hypothetical protein
MTEPLEMIKPPELTVIPSTPVIGAEITRPEYQVRFRWSAGAVTISRVLLMLGLVVLAGCGQPVPPAAPSGPRRPAPWST